MLAIAIILAVVLTVAIHNLGHYGMARVLGFEITRVNIGAAFGVWRWFSKDGMLVCFKVPPFGGHLELAVENRRPFAELLVNAGGALANVLAAALVLGGLYVSGVLDGESVPYVAIIVTKLAMLAGGAVITLLMWAQYAEMAEWMKMLGWFFQHQYGFGGNAVLLLAVCLLVTNAVHAVCCLVPLPGFDGWRLLVRGLEVVAPNIADEVEQNWVAIFWLWLIIGAGFAVLQVSRDLAAAS